MRAVRLGYAGVFAVAMLVCLWMTANLLHSSAPTGFIAGSIVPAVLFGVAAFRGIQPNSFSRRWSITASVLMVLLSLFAITYIHPEHFVAVLWTAAALGYGGLAVFTRRESKVASAKPASPANLPGDGTTAISSKLAALAAATGAVEGTAHWSTWASRHGLPLQNSSIVWIQYLIAVLLVLFLHEGGHALAGIALRMKVVTFVVGPFRWWQEDGRWLFEFRALDIVSFLGAAAVVPSEMENFRKRKFAQVAAGPVASLITGAVAVVAILRAPGHWWAAEWRVLAYFATISLVVAFLNFIPFKLGSAYSDGAKLYQLSREGLWSDYHRLVAAIHATKVTDLRPRDYDIATVERAAGTIARGADELNMHLCAYAHYLDNGQLAEARAALLRAEDLCSNSALEPAEHWYSELVFAHAFLRRDADAARRWWNRMVLRDSKVKQPRTQARLASRAALLLSEGNVTEAAEVWRKAEAWAHNLPKAGASDAQRHRIHLLGRALRERLGSVA